MNSSLYFLFQLFLVYVNADHYPITGRKRSIGPVGRYCIRNSECLSNLCYWSRCTEQTAEEDNPPFDMKNIFNVENGAYNVLRNSNDIYRQDTDSKDEAEGQNVLNKSGEVMSQKRPSGYHKNHRIADYRKSWNDDKNEDNLHLEFIKSSSHGVTRIPLRGIFIPFRKFGPQNHGKNNKVDMEEYMRQNKY